MDEYVIRVHIGVKGSVNQSSMYFVATIKFLTCIEAILLGVLVLRQNFGAAGNRLFALHVFFVAIQSFVEFHLVLIDDLDTYLIWQRMDVFVYPAVGFLLQFSLIYADIPFVDRKPIALSINGFFFAVAIVDSIAAHPISGMPTPWGHDPVYSAFGEKVYLINVLLASVAAIGTLFVFLVKFLRAKTRRERSQTGIMLSAMGVLIVTGISIEIIYPIFGVSVPYGLSATSAFVIVIPVLGYALLRYNVLAITPAAVADDILQIMSDGVLLLDMEGNIRFANRAAGQMVGISSASLLGLSVERLPIRPVSEEGTAHLAPFWVRETMVDKEGVVSGMDESCTPVSISSTPLIKKEIAYGFVVTLRDISVRKQAEERKNAVEKIMRHDLKNSLGAVIGLAEILAIDARLDASQRDWINGIYRSSEMMLRQIESYLTLEKMERGIFRMVPETVDLLSIAKDVAMSLSGHADDASVIIALTVNKRAVGPSVKCDIVSEASLVYSMLTNLAKNALEASPPNTTVTIDISLGEQAVVSVTNRGRVPEEIRACFFEKFVTHGKKSGTGLGTYSAKLIVENLGGTIALLSDDGDDLVTIVVTLPLIPPTGSTLRL